MAKIKPESGTKQANVTIEGLITYWQLHRQFDANMADLARYARVSRDTIYRWLKRKTTPKEHKLKLIQEWLSHRNPPD